MGWVCELVVWGLFVVFVVLHGMFWWLCVFGCFVVGILCFFELSGVGII